MVYSGFGVGCWDPFEGLEEVSALAINARMLSPQVKEFFSAAWPDLSFCHDFTHY